MYQVVHTNFGTIFGNKFDDIQAAVNFAKSKGFQAIIIKDNEVVASWSPIGGFRWQNW